MLIERGTIVGSYRVEGILGRGGMGVVYSASHVSLDRRVASPSSPPRTTRSPASARRWTSFTDALLSHFAYEERELVEPLARFGYA